LKGRVNLFLSGSARVAIGSLLDSLARLADAELPLLEQPGDRVAALERVEVLAGCVAEIYGMRVNAGQLPGQVAHRSRQFHATCLLATLDAKHASPAPRPKRNFPPAKALSLKPPFPLDPSSDVGLAKHPDALEKLLREEVQELVQLLYDESVAAPAPGDNDRRKLLKLRHAKLLSIAGANLDLFAAGPGRHGPEVVSASLRPLAESKVALNDQRAVQLAMAECELRITRVVEATNAARYAEGQLPIQDLEECRYHRLTAEIKLLELREQFPGVSAAQPAPAARRGAAQLWQSPKVPDLTAEERAEIDKLFPPGGPPRITPSALIGQPLLSVEPTAGDDQRRTILKARHKWATEELKMSMSFDTLERFRSSAIALSDRAADHIVVEERVRALLRSIELNNKASFTAGQIPVQDCEMSTVARLEAELRLLDAKGRATAPPARR